MNVLVDGSLLIASMFAVEQYYSITLCVSANIEELMDGSLI